MTGKPRVYKDRQTGHWIVRVDGLTFGWSYHTHSWSSALGYALRHAPEHEYHLEACS